MSLYKNVFNFNLMVHHFIEKKFRAEIVYQYNNTSPSNLFFNIALAIVIYFTF